MKGASGLRPRRTFASDKGLPLPSFVHADDVALVLV